MSCRPSGTMLLLACAAVLQAAAVSAVGEEDEARELFHSHFGAKIDQVVRTSDKSDDVALAREMLKLAKQQTTPKAFSIVLADEAYTLAARDTSAGDTAAEAAEITARHDPRRRGEALAKIVTLRHRSYLRARGEEREAAAAKLIGAFEAAAEHRVESGDLSGAAVELRRALGVARRVDMPQRTALQQRIDKIVIQQRVAAQIQALKARIQSGDQTAAEELLRLCVVELDDPEEARKYTFLAADQRWKTHIPLAAKDAAALSEAEAMQLGDWYRELAGRASSTAKAAMLVRARGHYESFLSRHADKDLMRTKAVVALQAVDRSLSALPEASRKAIGLPVTVYWLMADNMDIYQNGEALREYKPSFRTRADEARKSKAYSAEIDLKPGDVFTIGGRRGGSYGGTVVVVDDKNKLVWRSSTEDWRVYEPIDAEKWYLPDVARRSKQGPVQEAVSFGYQKTMRRDYDDLPQPIWGKPSQRIVYMVGVYRGVRGE